MYSLDPGDAEAAFAAGMNASEQYQAHYQANIAGDPMQAESAQQPDTGEQGSVT